MLGVGQLVSERAHAAPPILNPNNIISCRIVGPYATIVDVPPGSNPFELPDPTCDALTRVETAATAEVISLRGLDESPEFVRIAARADVTAFIWASIVDAVNTPAAERTDDEHLIADWMARVWKNHQLAIVDAAIAEYERWATPLADGTPGACTYTPPAPAEGEYPGDAGRWPGCFGRPGIGDFFGSEPETPSFEQFMRWGTFAATGFLAQATPQAALATSMLISLGSGVGSGLVIGTAYRVALQSSATLLYELGGYTLARMQPQLVTAGGRLLFGQLTTSVLSRIASLAGGVFAIAATAIFIAVQRGLELFAEGPEDRLQAMRTSVAGTDYDARSVLQTPAQGAELFNLFISSLDRTERSVAIPERTESDPLMGSRSDASATWNVGATVQVDDWQGNPQTVEVRDGYVLIGAPGEAPILTTGFPAVDATGTSVQVTTLRDGDRWLLVAVPVGTSDDCLSQPDACEIGSSLDLMSGGSPRAIQIVEAAAYAVELVGPTEPIERQATTYSLNVQSSAGPVTLTDIRWEVANQRSGNACLNSFNLFRSPWYDTAVCRVTGTGPTLDATFEDPGRWSLTVSGVEPNGARIWRTFGIRVDNSPPQVVYGPTPCFSPTDTQCVDIVGPEGSALEFDVTLTDSPLQQSQLEIRRGLFETLATTPFPCRQSATLTINIFRPSFPECTADITWVESPPNSGRYEISMRATSNEPLYPASLLIVASDGELGAGASFGTQSGWTNAAPVASGIQAPAAAVGYSTIEISGTLRDPGGTTAITPVSAAVGSTPVDLPTVTPNADGSFGFSWTGQARPSADNSQYTSTYLFVFADPQGARVNVPVAVTVLPVADDTPPVITFQPALPASGWYGVSTDTIEWTVEDPESEATVVGSCPTELPGVTDPTGVTFTCTAQSFGGTSTETVVVRRDAVPPTLTIEGGPVDGVSYPVGDVPPPPTCTANDDASGLDGECIVEGWADTAGSHRITVTATDRAGNVATAELLYNVVDDSLPGPVIKPVITGTLGSNGWYVGPSVSVSWDVSDPSGSPITSTSGCETVVVTSYTERLALTCTATSANGTGSTGVVVKKASQFLFAYPIGGPNLLGSYPVSAVPAPPICEVLSSLPAECVVTGYSAEVGEQAFYLSAIDEAGQQFTDVYAYTVFDDSAPTVLGVADGISSDGWFTSDVAVSFTVDDPHTPVTSTGCEPLLVTEDTLFTEVTCTATSDGGTATATVQVRRDATPPTLTLTEGPEAGTVYPFGTTPEPPLCDVQDDLSGPRNCWVTGYSEAPGAHLIIARGIDVAGNETIVEVPYVIEAFDTTGPSIQSIADAEPSASGWYTEDVTISWDIGDGESTVTATSGGCAPTRLTDDTEGVELTCSATSAGGTSVGSVTVRRDATAPTLDVLGGPADGMTYDLGTLPAAPSCRVSDATSGVDDDGCVVTGYARSVGTHTLVLVARDVAGNAATITRTYTVRADSTPPSVTAELDGPSGASGWFVGDVDVTWSTVDAESTVLLRDGCDPSMVTTDGMTELTCYAASAGGGVSATVVVTRDATPPTLDVTGGPTDGSVYEAGAVPPAPSCIASDEVSGIASPCTVSGYSSAPGDHVLELSATDVAGNTVTDRIAYSVDPDPDPGPDPDHGVFVSVAPSRFLDDRPTGDTFDDRNRGGGRTPAGGRVVVQIAGRGNVPADATAVIANLTAVNGTGVGYATAHPCLPTAPLTSSVNFSTGGLEPNEIIVKLDPQGRVCIDVFDADTFLLLDVVGYTLPGSAYTPINPTRYADTRPQGNTFDDTNRRTGPLTPGTTIEIPIAGRGNVPTNATAAAVNLTATRGRNTGFATVHPCLPQVPTASSINYTQGVNRPNEIVAQLSPRGSICITIGDATVDVIVDVVGHLTATATYTPITPTRIVDTRPQGDTTDDQNQATGLNQPGTTYRVQVTGRAGVPTSATQAIVNLTVAGTQNTGFATVHPCLPTPPTASSINYFAGTIRPNELIAQLDPQGGTCITIGDAATHLIVDITAHNG
jgi:hypothetical protein